PSESGYLAFQKAIGSLSSPNESIGLLSFIRAARLRRSPLRAAVRMRSRVRATGTGRSDRSVWIFGMTEEGVKRPVGLPWMTLRLPGDGATGPGGAIEISGLMVSVRMLVCASALPLAASISTRRLEQRRNGMGGGPIRGRPAV